MLPTIHSSLQSFSVALQEKLFVTFSTLQKRVMVIAVAILALAAIAYFVFRKKEIKATDQSDEKAKPASDLKGDKAPEKPTIQFSGWGFSDRPAVQTLVDKLYGDFYEECNANDPKSYKILTRFAELNKEFGDKRVSVDIVVEDRDISSMPKEFQEVGCLFHVARGGYSDRNELALSLRFAKSFDRLLQNENDNKKQLQDMMSIVVFQMNKAIQKVDGKAID